MDILINFSLLREYITIPPHEREGRNSFPLLYDKEGDKEGEVFKYGRCR
jgi:hypothetical protein